MFTYEVKAQAYSLFAIPRQACCIMKKQSIRSTNTHKGKNELLLVQFLASFEPSAFVLYRSPSTYAAQHTHTTLPFERSSPIAMPVFTPGRPAVV
jgi:hypothetical protein